MKRMLWGIVAIVVFCSMEAEAEESLQPLTIQLSWVTNVEFAGILLAKERGWYKEAGIDLTVNGWKPGTSPIESVLNGEAQLDTIEGNEIIKARASGQPVKGIAAQFQKNPFCIMSKKTLGITSPEHLAGKKVGYTTPDTILMIKVMLAYKGVKVEEAELVPIGFDLKHIVEDEVDAIVAYIINVSSG